MCEGKQRQSGYKTITLHTDIYWHQQIENGINYRICYRFFILKFMKVHGITHA